MIRNLLSSTAQTETHPRVVRDVVGRRDRAFRRDMTLVQRLAALMRPVEVVSKVGIFLGTASAFDLDDPRVDRFFERVSRGVLRDAYGLPYFDAHFDWRLNPPIPDSMLTKAPPRYRQRRVLDVFHYLATPESPKGVHWIILTFFERLRILAQLTRPKPSEPPNETNKNKA